MNIVKNIGWFILGILGWILWFVILATLSLALTLNDPSRGGSDQQEMLSTIVSCILALMSAYPFIRSVTRQDNNTHWMAPVLVSWFAVAALFVWRFIT